MQLSTAQTNLAKAERRREPRFPCHIECVASSIAGEFPITIHDVSESGFGFTSKTILPKTIQIAVKLETGPLEGAVGVVRWLNDNSFGVELFDAHKRSSKFSDMVAILSSAIGPRPA